MKKILVVSTLLVSAIVHTGQVQAKDSSKEENVGFVSGAITGAAIGGPIGLIVGGIAGVLVGGQVEKANQLDEAQLTLQQSSQREQQLEKELAVIQQDMKLENNQQLDSQWVTNGLTLNLMFTTNSAELSDADHSNIKRIAEVLRQFPKLNIQLDGYSDPRGSVADNLLLSQQRVNNVKQAFEFLNISAERLIGHAHGEIANYSRNPDMDAYTLARKVSVNFVPQSLDQVAQY